MEEPEKDEQVTMNKWKHNVLNLIELGLTLYFI